MSFLHLFRKRKASSEITELKFTKLEDCAILPTKAHQSDSGYDLHSVSDCIIPVGSSKLISTKIKVEFPIGYSGIIFGRSGLASKHSIFVHSGIIDFGYTGELGVILFNLSDSDYHISKSDRIAQLLVVKLLSSQTENSPNPRSDSGFGSTGK
jgi:dUTP pyrophosphatase